MSFTAFDHECMSKALRLAARGLVSTHPNPRVGCVISRNGRIVGSGWHQKTGAAHAEVNALAEAGEQATGATAYVTLEPCSHSGRTPPCVVALINSNIKRVVCAIEDPFSRVDGSGIQQLRQAGIEVDCGLMAAEAEDLNSGFLTRMRKGRPWVRIKLAQSTDGHIALANGSSQWISGVAAREDVQRWRARADAILTGVGTVLADNPSLNLHGSDSSTENARQPLPRQPLRVIVDSHFRTPAAAKLLSMDGEVLVAGLDNIIATALSATKAECIVLPSNNGRVDLKSLLMLLGEREINEVQVEAGAALCGGLLEQQLVDEILIYQAPILMGGGAMSPFAAPRLDKMDHRIHLEYLDVRRIGADLRLRLKPVYTER